MKITDIFSSSQDAIGILKTTRNAAAVAAAITSMTIVFAIAYGSAVEYMPRFFAYVFGFLAVSVVAFVVDYGFRQTLPLGLDLLISGYALSLANWKVGAFMFLLLGWNFIQGFASMKLSWEGRKEAIAAIQKEPELQDVAQVKAQVDRAGSAKIRALDSEIRELRQQIERKEAEVERLHPSYMEAIKEDRDRWGWNAKQLESRKQASTGAMSRQLDELMTARTRAIEAETESAQLTVSSVAAVNESKWSDYQVSKTRNMAYIGYFGSGCTIAVFIISLMISLLGQSEVKEVEQKEVVSPVRKAAPPHVAPAVAGQDDFELQRAIAMLREQVNAQQRNTDDAQQGASDTAQQDEAQQRNTDTAQQRNTGPQQEGATGRNTVANRVSGDEAELVAETLRKAKSSLRTYKSRLVAAQQAQHDATTKEEKELAAATLRTQQRGFAKWTQRVEELEAQLQEIS